MPRGAKVLGMEDRLPSKRSLFTGSVPKVVVTARPRLLAVLDKVGLLVPDTCSMNPLRNICLGP